LIGRRIRLLELNPPIIDQAAFALLLARLPYLVI
jgi:hypothetical protein